jgi:hypothetical protein
VAQIGGAESLLSMPSETGTVVVMKLMLSAFYAGLLAISCTALARADEASKNAKIEEMLLLTHADRILNQMMEQIQPMVAAQMKKMDIPEDARSAALEVQKKMLDFIAGKLSWERMKPVYVKIYSETLSEDEVAGAVAFYKTPAGQALLNKMPVLMQKSMAVMQDIMSDLVPEITKMSEEIERKYKKQ